jgi:hypothetical protein
MRFTIINDLFSILENSNMSNFEILEFVNDLRESIPIAPSLLVNEIDEKIKDYCSENRICSHCFCEDFYEDYEKEGEDIDGNRGVLKKIFVCKNCGEDFL